MPDCSAAQILIGGTIKTQHGLNSLLAALSHYGTEWGNLPFSWLEEIKKRAASGEPITVQEPEQPGGGFCELASVCEDLGLHYHQADDGHYSYEAQNTRYNPDVAGGGRRILAGNIDGGGAVRLSDLRMWVQNGVLAEQVQAMLEHWAPMPAISFADDLVVENCA